MNRKGDCCNLLKEIVGYDDMIGFCGWISWIFFGLLGIGHIF